MKRALALLALLWLCPWSAFAQTKDETINFIKSEYRSFEKQEYMYKEIYFSPAGDAFTLRRSAQKRKDYLITFQLGDVDIYMVTVNHPNAVNQYRLMVRTRGREGSIAKDGSRFVGELKISPSINNEKKCLALERAFTRLTTLTTGRKFLFYDPVK
jgi:uncharacterized protein YkuJ